MGFFDLFENTNFEKIDIDTKEGVEKAIEYVKNVKENILVSGVAAILGIDFDEVIELLESRLDEFPIDEDEDISEEDKDILDEIDEEFDTPFSYSEQVPEKNLNTIDRLVDEYVGELEVESDEEFDDLYRKELKDLLREFASFILLHD